MLLSDYKAKRHEALVLRDGGGYNLAASEMNPVFFEELVSRIFDQGLPPVVWEPFAGKTTWFLDYAEENNITLLSQTLCPTDSRMIPGDSLFAGPDREIGGVLFHPPYFGALPYDNRDVCSLRDRRAYIDKLMIAVSLFLPRLTKDGLVCAIGRDYRIGGQKISLSEWYVDLFWQFDLLEVWSSEPDFGMLMRRHK